MLTKCFLVIYSYIVLLVLYKIIVMSTMDIMKYVITINSMERVKVYIIARNMKVRL